MLERLPDVVRLEALNFLLGQKDLTPQVVVEGFGVLAVLAHFHARNVAIVSLRLALGVDFEDFLSFVVVNNGVVCQGNINVHGWGCRCVDVVNSALRHLVEHLEKSGLLHVSFVREEIADHHIIVRVSEHSAQLLKLFIGLPLSRRE